MLPFPPDSAAPALNTNESGFVPLLASVEQALKKIETSFKKETASDGVKTGFNALDRMTDGLPKKGVSLLAGHAAIGKTFLALQIALNVAQARKSSNGKAGAAVGYISSTISAQTLATRILSNITNIPLDKLRQGEIEPEDFIQFIEIHKEIAKLPFHVSDKPAASTEELCQRIQRVKQSVPQIGLIVIDDIQNLRDFRANESVPHEIGKIISCLKTLAHDLDIAILVLVQLSPVVWARTKDLRPRLSHLTPMGFNERDIDLVLFLHREEWRLAKSEPVQYPEESWQDFHDRYQTWEANLEAKRDTAEIIIAHNWQGSTGDICMKFDSRHGRFQELGDEEEK